MTTANETFRKAANTPLGREAARTVRSAENTARNIGDDVSDFADDVARSAKKQYGRARDVASDTYDELHDLSERNPHISLGIAMGLGFLLGVMLTRR